MEELRRCAHVEECGWTVNEIPLLFEIIKKARLSGCQDCLRTNNIKNSDHTGNATYMCLNSTCSKLGCGRNAKGHALRHYKSSNTMHELSLNLDSLQVWCYACDEYVSACEWEVLEKIQEYFETKELPMGSSASLTGSLNSSGSDSGSSMLSEYSFSNKRVGLYNLGNSCFINAALQILLNCPNVSGYFRNCHQFLQYRVKENQSNNSSNNSVAVQFLHLSELIANGAERAVSPAKLIRTASTFNPAFHGYSQQDSMDFFRMMLDRLHEELKYPVPVDALDDSRASKASRRKSGRLASKESMSENEGVLHKSVISDTFGGTLRSEVKCHKCKKVSVKDDQFFDLSLPLQPNLPTSPKSVMSNIFSSLGESLGIGGKEAVKLEGTFVNFCLPEVLDGKDRYWCESCKELVQSTKTLSIKSLPQILCVQLKRFRHDSYFSSKVNTNVDYPLKGLDLRHFLHKDFIGSPLSQSSEYDLLGIISHRGSFNGGHYVSYCRTSSRTSTSTGNSNSGDWLEFDDSRVKSVPVEEINSTAIQAYILFYIQKSSDGEKGIQRDKIIKEIMMNRNSLTDDLEDDENEAGSSDCFVSKQWFNRLVNSSNPGPIDSFDVTCPHGNLKPIAATTSATTNTSQLDPLSLLQPLTKSVAEELKNVFGELGDCGILRCPVLCTVCIEEREALQRRRRKEEEEVMGLDTSTIDEGDFWYLIETSWLVQWNNFKSGGSQIPPGPITNNRLFKGATGKLRDNLTRVAHYRGVNERVWNYFYGIYGGGPVLKRRTINIYNFNT